MLKEKITLFNIKSFLKKKPEKTLHQFVRYLVAGGTATTVDITVLFILYQLIGMNHLVAAAISYCCGILINFTANIIFVFKSSGRIKREFVGFVIIGIAGLLWTELILWVFSDSIGLSVMTAKLIAIIFVLFWNFFMRKHLVFQS